MRPTAAPAHTRGGGVAAPDGRRAEMNGRRPSTPSSSAGARRAPGSLRDLARRGLETLLVEKCDLGTGTSGRYHGLLHSGGRYVVDGSRGRSRVHRRERDPAADRAGLRRGHRRLLRGDARATPTTTGTRFAAACAAAGVPVDEVPTAAVRAREPALNPALEARVPRPDASLEPWQLIEANVADAPLPRRRGVAVPPGRRDAAVRRPDPRGRRRRRAHGSRPTPSHPRIVVSAAGAWAGRVAALAGADLAMSPGKGTMLIFNQRMTDTVVNRLKRPGDGDIMVPVHSVAILGTTEEQVDDPDVYGIRREEVAALLAEGEKLFPDLPRMRLLRAYAGVRPLYSAEPSAGGGGRRPGDLAGPRRDRPRGARRRRQPRLDRRRQADDLPAHGEADRRCRRPQARAARRPARPPRRSCPARATGGRTGWATGSRSTRPPAVATLTSICECELVTRRWLDEFLDERWPCSIDDVRRGTRLGMGPCQGGFCTFRAEGILAERAVASDDRRSRTTRSTRRSGTSSPSGSGARDPSRGAGSSRSCG